MADEASTAEGGGFTYSDGSTGAFETSGKPNAGSYMASTGEAASGKENAADTVLTITVPTKDVGSPPAGALLTDPQAFVQASEEGEESFTQDSSDNFRAYSVDNGELDSIGEQVPVDAVSGSNCSNTLPVTSAASSGVTSPSNTTVTSSTTTPGQTVTVTNTVTVVSSTKPGGSSTPVTCETTSALPVTHITHKALSATELKLSGTAAAHCPDKITQVSLAIAKTLKRGKRTECEFLKTNGKYAAPGSCAPRDYHLAKGTGRWTFALKVKLTKGIYYLWEHAVDSRRYTTKNVASRHVFLRIA
jgi:hypothetical protein